MVNCPTCSRQVPQSAFDKHKQFCKKKCDKCGAEVADSDEEHEEECPESPKTCTECQVTLPNKKALVNHTRSKHPKSRKKTPALECKCDVCGRPFKNSQALGNHKRTHSTPTPDGLDQCEGCDWQNQSSTAKSRRKSYDNHLAGHKEDNEEAKRLKAELKRRKQNNGSYETGANLGGGSNLGAGNDSTSNSELVEFLKSELVASRSSQHFQLRSAEDREHRVQQGLLNMAKICTRTTGTTVQVEGQARPTTRHPFQWSCQDLVSFVQEELQIPELAKQLTTQKANGLDLKTWTEFQEGKFKVEY